MNAFHLTIVTVISIAQADLILPSNTGYSSSYISQSFLRPEEPVQFLQYAANVNPYEYSISNVNSGPIATASVSNGRGPIATASIEAGPQYVAQIPTSAQVAPATKVAEYITGYPGVRSAVAVEPKTIPKYEYAYLVIDPKTGDHKSQQESRIGDLVRGEYSLIQPDGTLRRVAYTADDLTGFNAVVRNYSPTTINADPCKTVASGNKDCVSTSSSSSGEGSDQINKSKKDTEEIQSTGKPLEIELSHSTDKSDIESQGGHGNRQLDSSSNNENKLKGDHSEDFSVKRRGESRNSELSHRGQSINGKLEYSDSYNSRFESKRADDGPVNVQEISERRPETLLTYDDIVKCVKNNEHEMQEISEYLVREEEPLRLEKQITVIPAPGTVYAYLAKPFVITANP